ncbi:3-dehydroquinate dehydratase [Ramlibacter tataouinensis]|uniref:3-dehydroquinate dehydratase n=1 Tax=Ramlibacter tataouinensis TaxID=94132 RepID=A0A127JZ26_9BURK|nr:3-dehydroquinate dehydratase [Ramlibacter tataouinensis]
MALPGRAPRFPVVCAPLVARSTTQLAAEAAAVAAKGPDLLEWRVDFFEHIGDAARVLEAAEQLRRAAAGIPLLFTRRSSREGGQPITIGEEQVVDLYRAVCASGQVDLVDFEMGNAPAHVAAVREASKAAGLPLVLSFHDFQATPPADALVARFAQAQALGADVAKVAVMPKSMEDVLALLAATTQASRSLSIPVVSMSMGPLGAVTRMCGWTFGSAMTFAVGEASSAPGQMPIKDIRQAIAMLQGSQA